MPFFEFLDLPMGPGGRVYNFAFAKVPASSILVSAVNFVAQVKLGLHRSSPIERRLSRETDPIFYRKAIS